MASKRQKDNHSAKVAAGSIVRNERIKARYEATKAAAKAIEDERTAWLIAAKAARNGQLLHIDEGHENPESDEKQENPDVEKGICHLCGFRGSTMEEMNVHWAFDYENACYQCLKCGSPFEELKKEEKHERTCSFKFE